MRRRTLAREVCLRGHAVRTHTGEVTLRFAPGGDGFVFVRDDTGERYPATLEHLVEVPNCTALGRGGQAAVLFVEHALSALVGLGYSDAEIHLEGPEIPLFDGSAQPIADAVESAGYESLAGELVPLTLAHPVWHLADGQCLGALPGKHWSIDYCFEHEHALIAQDHLVVDEHTEYATEVAPARTFVTAAEARALMEQGLVRGGNEDMALVVHDDHFSAPLRLEHEFAAHKVLDLMGDLALLGRPLQMKLVAFRTGHAANHAFARRIAARLGLG